MAPPIGKLLPDDWSTIIFAADKIKPGLRQEAEKVGGKLRKAQSLIIEFQNMPVSFRNENLMKQSYVLLDEVVPPLKNVVTEFESIEKSSP
jgi:hypothetical protein